MRLEPLEPKCIILLNIITQRPISVLIFMTDGEIDNIRTYSLYNYNVRCINVKIWKYNIILKSGIIYLQKIMSEISFEGCRASVKAFFEVFKPYLLLKLSELGSKLNIYFFFLSNHQIYLKVFIFCRHKKLFNHADDFTGY